MRIFDCEHHLSGLMHDFLVVVDHEFTVWKDSNDRITARALRVWLRSPKGKIENFYFEGPTNKICWLNAKQMFGTNFDLELQEE